MVAIGKKAVNLRITENTTHGTLTEHLLKEVKSQMQEDILHNLTQDQKGTEARNHSTIEKMDIVIIISIATLIGIIILIALSSIGYKLSQSIDALAAVIEALHPKKS